METWLYAYVALLVLYKTVENLTAAKVGRTEVRPKGEWSASLIVIPFLLVLVGPPIEYLYLKREPGILALFLGVLFFLLGTLFRAKGRMDLARAFSVFIENKTGYNLVETGLYKTIRHPLYLGNVFLFVACPLFLGAQISWIFTVIGLAGIWVRIQLEERFLCENMPGYRAYMRRTSALFPRIF